MLPSQPPGDRVATIFCFTFGWVARRRQAARTNHRGAAASSDLRLMVNWARPIVEVDSLS